MRRFGWLSTGSVVTVSAFCAVVAVLLAFGGRMFSPGPLNADRRGDRELGGVTSHAATGGNCSACHAPPWSRETMASRCLNCHDDVRSQLDSKGPLHGKLTDGMNCRNCHTEHKGAHALLTDMTKFDHDFAAFKLTGKHESVDCKSCHTNSVYKGTPQTCISCHAEPDVHTGRFGAACASCHSTDTWKNTTLTLKNFDHDLTAFKLTGKHTTVDCKVCHVNEVFKGTKQTCVGCHTEPVTHKGRFGTACAQCHTTSTWEGATFKHTVFSINHGKKNNTCATCHSDTTNFKTFTCYNCHEHSAVKTERKHMRKGIVNVENCMGCHGNGRKKGRERAEGIEDGRGIDSLLAALQNNDSVRGCPVSGEGTCPTGSHGSGTGGHGRADLEQLLRPLERNGTETRNR